MAKESGSSKIEMLEISNEAMAEAQSSKTVTMKPAEAEESKTETQKITDEESKNVPIAATEEESKKLSITKVEESKNAATATTEGEKEEAKVSLKTLDGVTFEVEAWIAKEMETVQAYIDDTSADTSAAIAIPLHNVAGRELARMVEYCKEHRRASVSAGNLKEFEERFAAALNLYEMKDLIIAANYLNTKKLLESLSRCIAKAIKNKSVEFVRDYFGVTNDYTTEEEAQYRETNAWAFRNVDEDSRN